MKQQILTVMCSAALLASCGTYNRYERPTQIQAAAAYRDVETIDSASIAAISWREFFTDSHLQQLISAGLTNNADLRKALLQIEEAQAQLSASRKVFLPSVSGVADGSLSSFDGAKPTKTYNAGINIDWDVELAGRRTSQMRSDQALLLQAEANSQAVRSKLVATIADSYYTLLMLDEQIAISSRTLASWEQTVRTLRALKRTGTTDEAAVSQAEANLLGVEASLLTLEQQAKAEENAICSLIGISPQPVARGCQQEGQLRRSLSVGVPLQLLSNRPDVRQAELSLAQAFYATNIARAAFYPSLTLTGSAGWTNNSGVEIVNPGKLLLNAVASLTQPLWNKGQNTANLRIAKAQQEEAALTFQQKLLDAGIEVNDALTQWQTAKAHLQIADKQIAKLQTAVSATRLTMQHGSTTYLEVLTAEQSLLEAELTKAQNLYDEAQATINLYYALGGGCE